jgi:segregation and condensation protein A
MNSALTQACTLRLEKFEGPFDLLFHLIEKNQIDLYDIPILTITDQYMDYLQTMQELDLEVASEFLVMAATLLHIKSRMLLPVHVEPEADEVEDPREALILKLVAYRRHKEFAAVLAERGEAWARAQYKLPEPIPEIKREVVYEVSATLLREHFEAVLKRVKERVNRTEGKMARILDNERVSLKSKVREILRGLSTLAAGVKLRFFQLFDRKTKSRLEVATAFLAMLEVVKLGRARVDQPRMFDDIWLEPVESSESEAAQETAQEMAQETLVLDVPAGGHS